MSAEEREAKQKQIRASMSGVGSARALEMVELFAELWKVHGGWAVCHILNSASAERMLSEQLLGNYVGRDVRISSSTSNTPRNSVITPRTEELDLKLLLYDGRTAY